MRIFWTVSALMPAPAKALGIYSGVANSWVDAMSKRLIKRNDITLAIACAAKVPSVIKQDIDGIRFYVLPKDCDKRDYWTDILNDFNPDVIHAYGTENPHNILLLKNHSNIPTVVSLQAVMTEYCKDYYAGIDFSTMLRFTTIRDIVGRGGFFTGRKNFERRAVVEREVFRLAKNVEGRSTWDRVSARNINPSLNYFYCPRMIRSAFFDVEWNSSLMEKHTLFVHQAQYPIKGLHYVLAAVAKLSNKYPDIKLNIAGVDILHPKALKYRLFPNGYAKYIKYLIKKYDIADKIHYTGVLSASEMAVKLTKTNVAIIPSSIENAPNALAESMVVGTPTIATFVGGNMDMLTHNEEGFLYCYNEPNMLAEYISRIFDSDSLAIKFSENGKRFAREEHDPDKLENTLLGIYDKLITTYNNE